MNIAIAVWNNRISPLFDASRQLLIAHSSGYGQPIQLVSTIELEQSFSERLRQLEQLDVDVLVCGAISAELEEAIAQKGIEIVAFVAGNLEDVLLGWTQKELTQRIFSMPGCLRPRRRGLGRGGQRRRGRRRQW